MATVVAHAGGFSWDELLLFATPVIILVILQIVGRRRARDDAPTEQDGPGEEDGT